MLTRTCVQQADIARGCDLLLAQFASIFPGHGYLSGPMSQYGATLREVATALDEPLSSSTPTSLLSSASPPPAATAAAAATASSMETEHDLQRVPEWVRT
jgi:hypothetical protein